MIFKKNTTKCDRCEESLNLKKDKAYCFHSEEQEIYICEECVKQVFKEYVDEEQNRASNIRESD
jgi:NAD-dependent SIR2 family protein deacetylase